MLTKDDLHNIRVYLERASAGPWDFSQADTRSIDEHIGLVSDLLAKTTGPDLFMVTVAQEGHEITDHPLIVAITGNGETSEANAQFITMAREVLPRLLDDLLYYRHVIPVLQLMYRKHVRLEESIGYEELGEQVYTALVEAMGDLQFIEWLEHLP